MLFPVRLLIFPFLLATATIASAAEMEITPFKTFNQQPTVQIYGLPLDSSAKLAPSGRFSVTLVQEIANDYTTNSNSNEELIFDGEGKRTTIAIKYGISDRLEAGIAIPYVSYGGGFLDSFIIDWHDTLGLPQGGRDAAPENDVNYSYRRNGVVRLKMNDSGSGLGDISLTAGMKLYERTDADSLRRLAIRGDLKLPTGESAALRGSGSTDLALALCGMMDKMTRRGRLGLFGSLGGLAMSDSEVLASQHKNMVGFGTAGVGWGPSSWLSFKVQLNATTPFYSQSSLPELSEPSVMLVTGGALLFPYNYQLDIGVSEDLAVETAPDIAFHFALTKSFD